MEELSFQDKLLEFVKNNWLVLGMFLGGLIFIGIGLMQIMGHKTASVTFEKGVDVAGASTESKGSMGGKESMGKIKVDVEGQVENPGVYSLNSDARVQDALIAAGGLAATANRNALNLAQRIIDGQKVYVPAVGETASTTSTTSIMGTTGDSQGGLVSINNGSQSELESLPAIGPVTAQKIINGRPYSSIEELTSKKAVGKSTFEKIKDLIML